VSSVRARRGMTLIEVMVSLVLLAGVALGMAGFVAGFARSSRGSDARLTASDLASERLEEVKRATAYDSIESKYAKTENSIAGHAGFVRTTAIARVGGAPTDSVDYKIITVTVTGPGLDAPVRKSSGISAF
jgi:prepilin-type N-terminal cleavage/methylation domain-containing protein